ncbi:MAG: hypothetical protein FWF54_04570 [Candidatus Azobacteroides sp.]|nr:hypothetical protein [Candidatus Azobacteroides sp.]
MDWDISIGDKYKLGMLDSVEIYKSVDLLSDTATIRLPGTAFNHSLNVEDKVTCGSKVVVKLGYNDKLEEEFVGYVREITNDNGCIQLNCEDPLFLTRTSIPNKEFKNCLLSDIIAYITEEVKEDITYECDYNLKFDKFVINNSTGNAVLKKLQDETRANIYFKDRTLHVHQAYTEEFGRVKYDFAVNIETADLKYRKADQNPYQVTVEGTGKDGKTISVSVGKVSDGKVSDGNSSDGKTSNSKTSNSNSDSNGSDGKASDGKTSDGKTSDGKDDNSNKISLKVYGISDEASLKLRAEEELKRYSYDGYDGDITTFLIPFVDAGYLAEIHDKDYEYKDGCYYINSVDTKFSSEGAVRKVHLGFKIPDEKKEEGAENG